MINNLMEDLNQDSQVLRGLKEALDNLNSGCNKNLDSFSVETQEKLMELAVNFRSSAGTQLSDTDSLMSEFRHLSNETDSLRINVATLDLRVKEFETNMGYLELIEKIRKEKAKKKYH